MNSHPPRRWPGGINSISSDRHLSQLSLSPNGGEGWGEGACPSPVLFWRGRPRPGPSLSRLFPHPRPRRFRLKQKGLRVAPKAFAINLIAAL
jgi:hypothetical protein